MIYWWKIKLLLFIIKFLKIFPEWPNLLRGPKWHWTCWYQVSLVPDSHFWPQTRVGHSEEILRKVSEGCSLMWKGERGVQNDPPYFRGPKWDCPWTLRVILNPFPLSAVSFGNFSEEFLTMTHPTLGVQNGPVGKFPMALRVILDPPFLFLQWATAFRNFSEDFPRMTKPTQGVQNGIGPVGIKCPWSLTVILDPLSALNSSPLKLFPYQSR